MDQRIEEETWGSDPAAEQKELHNNSLESWSGLAQDQSQKVKQLLAKTPARQADNLSTSHQVKANFQPSYPFNVGVMDVKEEATPSEHEGMSQNQNTWGLN